MKFIGFLVIVFAIIFGVTMTNYLGNNLLPASNIEVLCDLATIIMFVSGVIIFRKRKNES